MSLAFERFKRVSQSSQGENGGTGSTPAASGASPGPLATSAQPSKILQDLLDCIETLKSGFEEDGSPIDDNNQTLHRFCAKLEYLLQADMKEKKTITGRRKDYWEFFCECLAPIKGVNDGIKYVKTTGDCKTSLGKGRGFLRFALMHHRLADSLQQCATNGKATSNWYGTKSIWLQHDKSSMVISALYDLNDLQFDLAPRGYDLDNAWPSFARKADTQQHTWLLSERARTMSVSSLNSIGQDSPMKSSMASTPSNDQSDLDHLAQELAISETVRSDMSDRMEALEQQKGVFQTTLAESRGEMNILESQLRELQAEHKELQGRHRELEKQYDKLCMESEVKERDGKSQESNFETKLSELKVENEKLSAKIATISEDFQLAQENLQITSSERDTFQSQCKMLAERIDKLEEQIEDKQKEINEKAGIFESEKAEMAEKLRLLEEDVNERARATGDIQGELKDQSTQVVNLERKVSAMTKGYQWLGNLKEGSDFQEIPDLDATSALTLKDVYHFVNGLQEKVTIAIESKEQCSEENKTLASQMTEYHQEALVCKEKVTTMETFVTKLQENEETLNRKVSELEENIKQENETFTKLKNDILEAEKSLTDSRSQMSTMEIERNELLKRYESKEKEVVDAKEDVQKQKNELQKTSEFYNLATKGQSDMLDKMNAQEVIIREKSDKLMEMSEREKKLLSEKNELEKEKLVIMGERDDNMNIKDKLGKELNDVTHSMEKLKDELSAHLSEKEKLLSKVDGIQKEINEKNEEISKIHNGKEKEKENFDQIKSEYEKEKSMLKAELKLISEEKNKIVNDLNSMQSDNKVMEKEICVLKEKQSTLGNSQLKMEENEEKLRQKLENAEKDLYSKSLSFVSLEKDMEMKLKEIEALGAENSQTKSELKAIQDQLYEKQSEASVLTEKLTRSQEEIERTKEFYATAAKTESDLSDRFKMLENNLNEKDNRISSLTETEKMLTVELSKITRDKEDLMTSSKKLQTEIEDCKRIICDKQDEAEKLNVQINNLKMEKDSLDRKIEEMEKQGVESNEALSIMQSEFEDTITEKDELGNMLRERDRAVNNIEKENRILEQKIFEMEQKEIDMTKALDVLKIDFDATNEEKERLERKIVDLEQKCEANNLEMEKLNLQCQVVLEENKMTLSKIHESDAVLTVEMQKMDKLKKEYESLSNDKFKLEETIESLQRDVHLHKETCEQQEKTICDAEAEKCSIEKRIQELEERDTRSSTEIEDLKSRMEDLQKNNLELTDSGSELENNNMALRSQIESLQNDIDSQAQKLKSIDEENASLKERGLQNNNTIEQLQSDIVENEKCKQKLADDILVFQEKESNNADTIKKLEETIQRTELEKESIQGILSLKSVEINELQARFDDFQSENSCLVQEYDLLQQSFNDLKITEEVVRAKLSEMTSERDELNTEMLGVKELLKVTQVQLHEETSEKDRLLLEKEVTLKEMLVLKDKVDANEKAKSEIESQYQDIVVKNDDLDNKLKDVENEIGKKAEEFNELHVKFSELESLCAEKDTIITDHEKTNLIITNKNIELGTLIKELENLNDQQKMAIGEYQKVHLEQEANIKELEVKLDQFTECKERLDESLQSINELRTDMDRIDVEKKQLIKNLEEMERDHENDVAILQHDIQHFQSVIEEAKVETESLVNNSVEEKSTRETLEGNIATLKREKDESIQRSQELQVELTSKIEHLQSTATQLTEQNERLALERDNLHEKEKDNKELNIQQQNEISTLKECNTSVKSKLNDCEKQVIELQNQLDTFEGEKNDCVKELRKTRADSEAKRNELEAHLEGAVNDLQVIKDELSDTTAKLEQVYLEKQNLEILIENTKVENGELIKETQCLQGKIELHTVEYEKLLEEINDMKTRHGEMEQDNDSVIKERESLQEDIRCMKDEFQQKINEQSDENGSLLQMIEELKSSVEETKSKENEVCSENEELQKENEKHKNDLHELSEKMIEKDGKFDEMAMNIDDINAEKDELNEKIDKMEKDLVEKCDTISSLSDDLKNSTELNEQLRVEIDGVKSEKQIIVESEIQMTEQIDTFTKQNEELLEQNKSLIEQCERYEKESEQKCKDICCLEEKLAQVELSLNQLESQNEKTAQDSEAEMDSLREEVSALEFQLSSKQLEEEKAQKSQLDDNEFMEMKDKVMEQETIIEQLQREMTDLRVISQQHREQEVLIEKMNQELEGKTSENRVIRDELTTIREDLNDQMTSSLTVQNKYGDEKCQLEDQLRAKDEEIKQLHSDSDEMKKKLVKLIREKDSLWQKTDRLSFQQKLQASEKWMDDGKVTHCLGCNSEFSFTLRKHHCRLCGRIFCHNCSSNWVLAAHSSKKTRACKECYSRYTSAHKDEEDGRGDSDIEQSVEIPKRRVLGRTNTGGDSMNTSMASSTSSDPDLNLDGAAATGRTSDMSGSTSRTSDMSGSTGAGSDRRLAVAAVGETGGNETDEDKLKDSTTNVGDPDEREEPDRFHVVSDEEIQRSLSLSEDTETMAKMDPNITCSMLISLDELERGEVNSQNEVWIKPGKAFIVPVRITRPDTIFGWEFTSYPKDVVFSVTYRASLGLNLRDGQSLVPQCKCDSHKQVTKGELTAKQLGIYTLMFDNTYSRLTSKRINYSLFSNAPASD